MHNKTEHFRYNSECGVHWCIRIEALKEELAWATDKQIKTVIPLRN